MITGDAKEEVRSRIAIEDVIGEYVPLKRAGRSWKGLSPFSQEKTASFFVSPDKQIWHDFSSNKGGDVFSFVMEVEGIEFRQALELLARKAGIDLSLYQSNDSQGFAKKKQRLLAACEAAATFYQHSLIKNKTAIEYVSKKRGLDRHVVVNFRLGYAPGSGSSLGNYLRKKDFSSQEIRDAGLVSSRGSDMFRERMVVPLSDGQGQVVGFTARLLSDVKNAPKYINTPQTLLYDKGRHVFGLAQAKAAIRNNDYVVVVEGNLDVISSHQAGIKQVVATAGTALTENHLKALSRLTSHIYLCFDSDKAGVLATERAIAIAQNVGVELSVISLPGDFKDPDELIRHDARLWQEAITSPQAAVEWIIDQYSQRYDITTPEGARELSTQALRITQSLKDPVEREHYIGRVAEVTGASRQALESKLREGIIAPEQMVRRAKPVVVAPVASQDPDVDQDYLLGLAVFDASVHDTLRHLHTDDVSGEARKILLGYILSHLGEAIKEPLPVQLRKIETYVKMVLFKAETWNDMINIPNRSVIAAELVRNVKEQQKAKIKATLDEQLFSARQSNDETKERELLTRLSQLIKEKKRAPRQRT